MIHTLTFLLQDTNYFDVFIVPKTIVSSSFGLGKGYETPNLGRITNAP
jgi:hypothetical protein